MVIHKSPGWDFHFSSADRLGSKAQLVQLAGKDRNACMAAVTLTYAAADASIYIHTDFYLLFVVYRFIHESTLVVSI